MLGVSSARADDKGKAIELDGLKSPVPGNWVEEKTSSSMRFAQFRLPKAADDKADAEVVIFRGIGGSAQANIERWKSFFAPPEGKTIGDVAKVGEIKVGNKASPYLQVCGTYKFKVAPQDPNSKEELRPNYCMLAVVFEGKDTVYHIRVVGPQKTIEKYQKDFEDWLKNFK